MVAQKNVYLKGGMKIDCGYCMIIRYGAVETRIMGFDRYVEPSRKGGRKEKREKRGESILLMNVPWEHKNLQLL